MIFQAFLVEVIHQYFPTVRKILEVELNPIGDIENVDDTKIVLEDAISKSIYLTDPEIEQRPYRIRWNLAAKIDLYIIKSSCPDGYATFSQSLVNVAKLIINSDKN